MKKQNESFSNFVQSIHPQATTLKEFKENAIEPLFTKTFKPERGKTIRDFYRQMEERGDIPSGAGYG